MPDKISVIIPTLNEEANLERLLNSIFGRIKGSLLNCSEAEMEIIICDGGSTDGTAQLCRRYPVRYLEVEQGRGKQLNAGAKIATGKILLFLHADSQLELSCFADLQQVFSRGLKWGCCSLFFEEETLFYQVLGFCSRLRARYLSSCYGDQGLFCERELFFEVGGYPELPLMEDLVLSQRLAKQFRAAVLPARIVTSTRRFREQGPLRLLLKMQYLKLLFRAGVPAQRLEVLYRKGDL